MGTKWSIRTLAGMSGAVVVLTLGLAPALAPTSAGASSSQLAGAYGKLPTQHGTPEKGGIVQFGEDPTAGPTYIFPITPASDLSAYDVDQFQDLMWRPLWWSPLGADETVNYPQSIAPAPKYSNANKTVTITIKPGWKWSDGTPVTSTDVAFDIDLIK